MSDMISRLSITPVLLASLTLFGCGSSGGGDSSSGPTAAITYSGASVATAIDAANAEELTTTAGEAVKQGADSSSSNVIGVVITDNSDDIETLSASLASAMASMSSPNLPTGLVMNGSCGGSVSIPDEQLTAFNAESGPVSFTMTYTSYCDASVGAQYTIDGQVVFNYDDIADLNSGFSLQYNGVTVNDGSGPITINMTVDCSNPPAQSSRTMLVMMAVFTGYLISALQATQQADSTVLPRSTIPTMALSQFRPATLHTEAAASSRMVVLLSPLVQLEQRRSTSTMIAPM